MIGRFKEFNTWYSTSPTHFYYSSSNDSLIVSGFAFERRL